jgi:hypothetical protein
MSNIIEIRVKTQPSSPYLMDNFGGGRESNQSQENYSGRYLCKKIYSTFANVIFAGNCETNLCKYWF